jgi:medium-chain acyl-[acyl-carrier-protein] hydrolase
MNLYCLPYAGGSAAIYSQWKQYLNPYIVLKPIELSGRGKRFNEAFYNHIQEAVDDVFGIIKNEIQETPYALFGHSMGGLIAYELAQKIGNYKLPNPAHIFISGRSAPHVKRGDERLYSLMNDIDFRQEVLDLGGTPQEFFDHPELLELFLPLLKNDFRMVETYKYNDSARPLDVDMTVLLGKQDDLTKDHCDGWKQHTKLLCDIHYFKGGHFFLNNETKQVVQIINHTCKHK